MLMHLPPPAPLLHQLEIKAFLEGVYGLNIAKVGGTPPPLCAWLSLCARHGPSCSKHLDRASAARTTPQSRWLLLWSTLLCVQVNTLNVEGKKKRGKYGFFRRPDYKKAVVVLQKPAAAPPAQ